MKILQVSKYFYPISGGIETVVYDLAEGLNKIENMTCDVLCFNTNGNTIDSDTSRGYKVFRAGIFKEIFSAPVSLKYITLLKRLVDDYDIIHVHLPNPLANLGILLSQLKKTKIIVHWHSDIVRQRLVMPLYGPLQNKLLKIADAIIVTSENYLAGSKELWPYKYKVKVIPIGTNGGKINCDNNALKERFGNKKIIFSLGRHVYYKGLEHLIVAAKNLSKDTMVIIGGTGPLTSAYQNLINEHQLNDKVILSGRIPENELPGYFSLADVFCLPSNHRSEAYGVVLVEAMSYKLPLVTTSIPYSGVNWVNQVNETGLETAPNDPDSLAIALNKILEDKNLWSQFSNNAFKRFNDYLTAEKMVLATSNLYYDVINDNFGL